MKTITLDQTYTVSDETAKKIQELIDRDKKSPTLDELLAKYDATTSYIKKTTSIAKMLVVAKHLNGDWQPDWNDKCEIYILAINSGKVMIEKIYDENVSFVYFKTVTLAQEAIDILGEETIRTALSTDY